MADLLDFPVVLLTDVCQQLDLRDLVRLGQTCKRFRGGNCGLETAELLANSPVVTALHEHAFPGGGLLPRTRPMDCSESWVAVLTRCARQRRCREAPLIAAGDSHSLYVDAAGRLLAGGEGVAVGHGDEDETILYPDPTPVAAMAAIWVRSVAAGDTHSLALTWDGRVYSWGKRSVGSWATETCSAGPRRRWCGDSRACAASPRPLAKAWSSRTLGSSLAGAVPSLLECG
jgi:hypothetical protein